MNSVLDAFEYYQVCYFVSDSFFISDDKNELHIRFCSLFLEFWDTFLVLCRLPIFSITWHAVSAIENQVML